MSEDQARRVRAVELAIEIARLAPPIESIEAAAKMALEVVRQIDGFLIGRPEKEESK